MRIDREIILSVLKLTQQGPAQKDHVAQDAHTSNDVTDEVLRRLKENSLVEIEGKSLTTAPRHRVELAIEAIRQGADLQHTSRFLGWKEFENITATAFSSNGYAVKRNFRFKAADRRWEIDLVACNRPRIVCADCKHWQRWNRSTVEKVADAQVERTKAFADSLWRLAEDLGLSKWTNVTIVPMVVALAASPVKLFDGVPAVSVLQLQDFINGLPTQATLLTHFSTIITDRSKKLTEF
jgi:Holliday junction resolvase-like predicted endonuclease